MDNNGTFIDWLELESNSPIPFEDLPRMLAEMKHPTSYAENGGIVLELARIEFESDLKCAVKEGRLHVRNPLTGVRGHALNGSVVFPWQDLQPLLADWGIGVRIVKSEKAVQEPPKRAVPREEANRAAILHWLQSEGFDPLALPRPAKGLADPVKQRARSELAAASPPLSRSAFDKAWKALRRDGLMSTA